MGRIGEEIIQQVRDRIDIVELVGRFVIQVGALLIAWTVQGFFGLATALGAQLGEEVVKFGESALEYSEEIMTETVEEVRQGPGTMGAIVLAVAIALLKPTGAGLVGAGQELIPVDL